VSIATTPLSSAALASQRLLQAIRRPASPRVIQAKPDRLIVPEQR
jgi:hypothetical protein